MNKKNFVIAISIMDKGIQRVEHSKIRNSKISLKLFVWEFPEKEIIGSSLHQNNRVVMPITKLVEEIK